jgi:anthranilate synthase/aminodeoxychorismate synthase-like glutamine amidotransferase
MQRPAQPASRLLLLDNHDSFTFNLAQGLAMAGAEVEVVRSDALTVAEALRKKDEGATGLVLSPGPGRPEDAGVCPDLLTALFGAAPDWPVLGVCLGHQLLGQCFGARVVRAAAPIHGKIFAVVRTDVQDPLWRGVPEVIEATRYHSLVVDPKTLPDCLLATAYVKQERDEAGPVMMAMRHRSRPLFGVQFHPESVGTPHGQRLLENFVAITCSSR